MASTNREKEFISAINNIINSFEDGKSVRDTPIVQYELTGDMMFTLGRLMGVLARFEK